MRVGICGLEKILELFWAHIIELRMGAVGDFISVDIPG
jgi:hypothetical protein